MKNVFILSFVSLSCFAQLQPNHGSKDLDKNYVRAKILTDNDKFWNKYGNLYPAYEVPKGQGIHASWGSSMWIGGLDPGGQLHIAANIYKSNGMDFWPGPLDTTNIAAFSATNSNRYNKLWKVDCNDINNFVAAFNSGSVSAGTYTVPDGILTYPAKGTANFQKNMLPFLDVNNNGLYSPQTDGDYPYIKGHQQVLSIYNDKNGTHGETGAPAMGIEVYERSYAYFEPNIVDSMQSINYTTFYLYTIYNRSNTNYHDVYVTDWADIDIGNNYDDYVGTDVTNNFAYCYNGNPIDTNSGPTLGYGNKPPVMSHFILKTNCGNDGIDNNNNSLIDEPGEQFGLNRTTYYNWYINPVPQAISVPTTGIEYYNYMTGFWKDGSQFTLGGNAYGGTFPTSFIYTGDPSVNTGWTEGSAANAPADRRIMLSSGPFNFPANSKIEWGYAIVFSRDTSQVTNTITQFNTRVIRDVKSARYYDETHQFAQCMPQVNVGMRENENKKLNLMVYPNPFNGFISIDLNENVKTAEVTVLDVYGRLILQSKITDSYRTTIDLSTFEKGIYFVRVSSGNKQVTEKIIKN